MAQNHHHGQSPPAGADSPRPDGLSRTGATLLLTVSVLAFYWQLLFSSRQTWLAGSDTIGQVVPWMAYAWGEFRQARLPLWDPNLYLGQPLLAQGQPQAAFPLNWLLYALPLHSGWPVQAALHWLFAVLHLVAARSAYVLARGLGTSRWGALAGGLAFTFTAWMGSVFWPQMLAGAIFAPMVLHYAVRLPVSRAPWIHGAMGGLFLGVCWLTGHHQIPIFVSLAAAAVCLHTLWNNRRLAGPMALFWTMAFAAGALQTLPALEYGKLAVRWVNASQPVGWKDPVPYTVHTQFSLDASALATLFSGERGLTPSPFLGLTVCGLAAYAVIMGWRRRPVRLLIVLALASLLYALGAATPLEGLAYALLPMVEKARSPAMAIMLFGLAASMLAALGLDALLKSDARGPCARRLVQPVMQAGLLLLAVAIASRSVSLSASVAPLVALALAVLLAAWKQGRLPRPTFAAGLCALILAESAAATWWRFPAAGEEGGQAGLSALAAQADIASYLRAHSRLARIDVDDRVIAYNFGDWFDLPQYDGYVASVTSNVYRLGLHRDFVRRLAGVEFLVANEPTSFFQQEVFRSRSGVRVYRNPDVLPRAFAVHRAVQAKSREDAVAVLEALGAEATRAAVFLEPPPALESCEPPDAVWVNRYTPDAISIGARLGCRGLVILSDTFYPGWIAEVDGRPARIWEVDGAFRGVVVAGGVHRLDYRYRPSTVLAGAGLTALAFATGAVLAAWAKWVRHE